MVSLGKPQVEVPFVVGQQREEAADGLTARASRVKFEERESDEPARPGPRDRSRRRARGGRGHRVTVVYSDGPEKIPNVVGMTQQQAEKALREAGFEPDVVPSDDTTEPKGTVIQQSPPAGEAAQEGATVTIVVSTFEEPTEPPSPTDTPTDTPTCPPRRPTPDARCRRPPGLSRPRPTVSGRSADGLGVGDVEQAVVRRRGDLVVGVQLPADRDVGRSACSR